MVTRWVTRSASAAPWVTLAGVVILLLGLSQDAILHRADPGLAAREGIVSSTHALFGVGIAITVVGATLFLIGRAGQASGILRRSPFVGMTAAVLALSLVTLGLARSTDGGLGGPSHVHENGTEHTHTEHQEFLAQQASPGDDMARTTHEHEGDSAVLASQPQQRHDEGGAPAAPKGIVHPHDDGRTTPTAAEVAAADKFVADVRAGTARFADFSQAQAEGYQQVTPNPIIAHYMSKPYALDGRVVDPARPEQLIYLTLPNGQKKLVGVMFLAGGQGKPGPQIAGPLTQWHAHDNICFTPTGTVGGVLDANGQCPPGTAFRGTSWEMLHVWLVDNPNGAFDEGLPAETIRQIVIQEVSKARRG